MDMDLTHETLTNFLNTEFQVDRGGEKIQLFLIEISKLKKNERQEQFSIVFRGPLEPPLSQGIHQFQHAKIGSFELFVVPINRDEEGYQYEAVFNRLAGAEQLTA